MPHLKLKGLLRGRGIFCENKLQPSKRSKSLNKLLDYSVATWVEVEDWLARIEKENQELNNKVDSFKYLMDGAKIEMKIRAVDRYKSSLAFDAFMHWKFRNGMKECQSFLQPVADKKVLVPSKEGDPKVYANDKAGSYILGEGEEDLVLSEKEESDDQASIAKFRKGDFPSKGVDIIKSSNKMDSSRNPESLVP
ncbi:hypothetical protein ACOSQ4_023229 [Xanthoceras sorbifolium]